ncbi:hypothetical protein [Halocatena marina]|uniref:Integrase n=1 Tax=Halocatena marina TaxID=2934937 RepID=A0ABD5YU76_9EURY|nr:hypothetical protein [Halocatena marina]
MCARGHPILPSWEAVDHYAEDHRWALDADTMRRTIQALAAWWDNRIEETPAVRECDPGLTEPAVRLY